MPPKIKPSTKEYVRDARGRMTNKWSWKHYTPSSLPTEELLKYYESPSYKRKKEIIRKELIKRNAFN